MNQIYTVPSLSIGLTSDVKNKVNKTHWKQASSKCLGYISNRPLKCDMYALKVPPILYTLRTALSHSLVKHNHNNTVIIGGSKAPGHS